MKKNYSELSSCFKPGFFLVFFLFFSFNGFGQSISNVTLSSNQICPGTELQVNFRATNGNRWRENFDSNTNYIISIGIYNSNNSSFNTFYQKTFQSSQPSVGNVRNFERNFDIPLSLEARNDYRILVSSTNPDVSTTAGLSEIVSVSQFEVRNIINLGASGITCGTANENGILSISAPENNVFIAVDFSSYGTPNGTCGNFTKSSCHADTSKQIVEDKLLGEVAANISATNTVFGDPCVGTVKRLYVQASYGQTIASVCKGSNPGIISGSIPSEGNESFIYLWESSSTGEENDFSAAVGTNDNKDYDPGMVEETTWFRRKVISGNCGFDISNIVKIEVKNTVSVPTIFENSPLCEGEKLELRVSDVPGANYNWTGPNGFTSNQQNPDIPNITAAMAGKYTVTATVNGCTSKEANTNVVVNTIPTIKGTTPGSRCGPGTVDLGATASAGTINWYAAATGGTSLGTGTTFTTPNISSNTPYYVDATFNGCTTGTRTAVLATVHSIPSAPTVNNNGPICVEGKLELTASFISGASYSWTGPNGFISNQQNPQIPDVTAAMAGTYTVTATVNGCTSEPSTTAVVVNVNTPSTGDETVAGTDSWVGHVYDGTNFDTYLGIYTEPEEFKQGFGGNTSCFEVSSENGFNSLYTETFSVRYLNATSKTGLYVVDLQSDDGIRLKINDKTIHEYWSDRGPGTDSNVLLNLDEKDNLLTYEYYENGGGNVVEFQNLRKITGNQLSGALDQVICDDTSPQEITGDDVTLVNGITKVGTGFQWVYSTTENGSRTLIPGATQKNFTPNLSSAPFNQAGEYFIYRRVSLQSTNNKGLGAGPYITTHESNAAHILIAETPQVDFSASHTELCLGGPITLTADFTGTGNYLISAEINGAPVNNITVNDSFFPLPLEINETTTFTITRIEDTGTGCVNSSPNASVTITVKDEWEWTGAENTNWNNVNNWRCNSLPTLLTDVLIPENLPSGNYPEITAGNNALVKNLVIENNASVLVDDNWLRIAGNLTNSGILNSETGSISFEGSSAQIIPDSAFKNNRIKNLRIDNTSGVTSEAIIEVTRTLKVENGNLETGNELTLISDETQTALIDGSGNGEVSGLVNMQRYLDKAFGYKYFSSPFQNSIVADFGTYMDFVDPVSSFPHFYQYNENRNVAIEETLRDATGWEPYIDESNFLNVSEGYALNFGTSATPQTIELIGKVNNGNIPPQQLLNHHRKYTKGFHLVGNPYPSPIDWNAAPGWTRNNIDDGIYFFTASDTDQYTGTYTAFVNDISTADPQVDGRSSNIIPSMQGFFIKVSDSDTQDVVTGDFGMDNRVRVTDFDQEFLRTQLPDQKSLLRLEAGFNGAARKDPMVIYFSPFASPNFEKEMDAHKLMNTDPAVPSFYNLTDDRKELAINAIPFPETGSYKKIPLGIKADQSGEMKITLNSIENLSLNFNIYLIDHAKGIGQNLSQKPEYRFNIEQGIHNSRFELMFSEEKVTNPAIAFDAPFHVETRDGDVIVKLNLEDNQEGILRASTMTGQILQTKKGTGKEEVIFNGITSDGVYIINLQLGKNHYAKKVVIKK